MYCPECGENQIDGVKFCTNCGTKLTDHKSKSNTTTTSNTQQPAKQVAQSIAQQPQTQSAQPTQATANSQVQIYDRTSNGTLYLVAFILNIISCVSVAVFLIPLAWMVPMTVLSFQIYKGKRANTTAFGVCTLIFLNLISGILMLCETKEA